MPVTQTDIQLSPSFRDANGTLGTLESRLATSPDEVNEALSLRYRVFCEELKLGAGGSGIDERLDRDDWDNLCDHLLIYETEGRSVECDQLVATSRLLTSSIANSNRIPFYSQSEFDIQSLCERHPNKEFLELGRTCVSREWRTRRCIELLWHGIWAYSLQKNVDVMVGCASFHGMDVHEFADPLAYLYHNHSANDEWQVDAISDAIDINLKAVDEIDRKKAFKQLPPLIKGYLRLGAFTSSSAVVDRDFGTIDVLIILPVDNLNPRHVAYYGKNAERHAG